MKEKDLHKIIRDNSADDNTALSDALKSKHPELANGEQTPEQSNKRKRSVNRLVAIFAPLSAAAVLTAVLVPTLLFSNNNIPGWITSGTDSSPGEMGPPPDDNSNDNNSGAAGTPPDNTPDETGTPPDDWVQSTDSVEYDETTMQCTVQQYNETYGTSFLYFDVVATDYLLTKYCDLSTQAFLGLEIRFIDKDTNEKIVYAVCTPDAEFKFLPYKNTEVCTNQSSVSDCPVKWGSAYGTSYGIFSYDGYDYYIDVRGDRSRLFELIQTLLKDS